MDAQKVIADSEIAVEFDGLRGYYDETKEVPFRLRRRTADGAWLYEIGSPVAAVPQLAGIAREEDVREFAQGILDTIERWAGEPDFLLWSDGYAQVQATVGYGHELYFMVEAFFNARQDRVGTSPDGEPLYSNPFGGAHVHLGEIQPDCPEPLVAFAQAVLAALNA
ncbi:hypothetical protein [Streptomyces sp. NPDC090445]|uniref:hypothetical protein n=1 Tax=Streptomyces sp. NPDC090445 TaxID=3365963 RepID=UPI0037F6D538